MQKERTGKRAKQNVGKIKKGGIIITKKELIEKIEKGSDIMLDVGNRHYTILTWMDEGIAIDEQYPNDGAFRYYKTASELVDRFMVNEESLGEQAGKVVITDYT